MAKAKATKKSKSRKSAPKAKKSAARKAAPKKKAAPRKKAPAKMTAPAPPPSRYCLGRCARCTGGCSLNQGHSGAHDCGTH